MDFIERLFHVAPDHGDGRLEMAIILAGLLALMAFTILRRIARRRAEDYGDTEGPGVTPLELIDPS